jgi:hypothetical protein
MFTNRMRLLEITCTLADCGGNRGRVVRVASEDLAQRRHPLLDRVGKHVDQAAKPKDGRVQRSNCVSVFWILSIG